MTRSKLRFSLIGLAATLLVGAGGKCMNIVYELIDSVVADAVGEEYRGLGALSDYFH